MAKGKYGYLTYCWSRVTLNAIGEAAQRRNGHSGLDQKRTLKMRRDTEVDAEGLTLRGLLYLPDNPQAPVPTEGRFDMKHTRTRLMGVAAALSAIAIAVPVSTAGAATAAPAVARAAETVIGPTYITNAPSTFINTNNQVSPGNNSSGDQVAA
jgi:hypothetical protein